MTTPTDELIANLVAAHRDHVPTPAPHEVADLDEPSAYAIQSGVFTALFGIARDAVRGYKIGLATNRDQAALQTDHPTCGRLAEAHFVASPAELTGAGLFAPIIEPELVFLFDADLSPGATVEEIIEKSRLAAAFDVPDCRYTGWPALAGAIATDLIADNSCTGLIVHGPAVARAADVDLPTVRCTMTIDGELFGTGVGADVAGSPANPVAWLSNVLAERGEVLRRGDRVSSGAMVAPSPVKQLVPGRFAAEFTGIGEVRIDFRSHCDLQHVHDNCYPL